MQVINNVLIPFEVIERFALRSSISQEKSIEIHEKMIEYLDASSKASESLSPSELVDEAWHSFILHTQLYRKFCNERYGKFIHHCPTSMTIDLYSSKKMKVLLSQKKQQLVFAACNDGTGDGNCSGKCGQGNCNSDGDGD